MDAIRIKRFIKRKTMKIRKTLISFFPRRREYARMVSRIEEYKSENKQLIGIVELNGLGDYIWAQSFFRIIKESYPEHILILICRDRIIEFARKINSDYIDEFIVIADPQQPSKYELRIFENMSFKYLINFKASVKGYEELTNNIRYERFFGDDAVVGKKNFYRKNRDIIFSQFMEIPNGFEHSIRIIAPEHKLGIEKPYVVFVPSGFTPGSFSVLQCKEIIEYILSKTRNTILFLGTELDRALFNRVLSTLSVDKRQQVYDGCGKLYAWELPYYISEADWVLTPNTSTYHIALLTNRPVVVATLHDLTSIDFDYSPFELLMNPELDEAYVTGRVSEYKENPSDSISDISVDKITGAVDKLLTKVTIK